jgi:citrate lyase subunit beta/citryl-CoA lyase
MLFVPADSERKLARAAEAGADALVLDLEDSVLPERKPLARTMMRVHLNAFDDHSLWWVRVNSLSSGELLADLVAAVPARPFGIVLPKIFAPEDLVTVGHYLDALEAEHGLEIGSIRIAVLVTETPSALLRLGELVSRSFPRLTAVMWGAEDLSSVMGAGDPRNAQDPEGLATSCAVSRHDGFTGRVAIHPNQVAIINSAYSPDAVEIELAQRIVAAFADGAGAVAIDGKMYDIPHLKAANRLLATLEVTYG